MLTKDANENMHGYTRVYQSIENDASIKQYQSFREVKKNE